MSKLSFRARALDASKPMPIYQKDELSDLQDYSVLNRAVPQMPSGMEKEEESEHHLQRAISAQQVYGDAKVMVIPVPEAEISLSCYNNLYKKPFRVPKHYIHNQALTSIFEQEKPDYDMDSEDEKWVKDSKKRVGIDISTDQFEEMIDRLEKSCGKQIVTLQEAKLLLKEDDDLIKAVYEYWTKKRFRNMGSLILQVRQERRDGSSNNDCYVAFRRRTEKMQTRKNRKNDESSYEKMFKLRRELSRAVTILEMIKRREKSKRELVHLTLEVFEKRYQMKDWDGKCLRAVKKELIAQRARSQFRPLACTSGQFRKKRLFVTVNKPKPTINSIPSISRGELNRDDLPKKLKKKRQRLPLTSTNGTVTTSYSLHTSKSVSDWRNIQNRTSSVSTFQSSIPAVTSKSPSMSYQDVVDTMTQYEFPASDTEESTSPLSSSMHSDGFDPKKHPDGIFTFRRKPNCSYYAPRDTLIGDWPWNKNESSRYKYSLTSLSVPDKCIGFVRRRIGRGGRVLLDRAYHPYQKHFDRLDLKSEHTHQPPTAELQELLTEIKKKRWRHYQGTKATLSSITNDRHSHHEKLSSSRTCSTSSSYYTVSSTKSSSYLTTSALNKTRKLTSKKSQSSVPLELSKTSVAFAMSALVTVAPSTTVTTTTNSCTKVPRTATSASQNRVLAKAPVSSTRKCVTCGALITFTSTTSDTRSNMGSSSTLNTGSNPAHHRVVPLTLSLASSVQQSASHRTAVLPATVNVSVTRSGGGIPNAGVPAVLRISSSFGGTVLYPQPQATYVKTEDAALPKSKKELVSMATIATSVGGHPRRTSTQQRTPRGPVLALPANVLASINNDSTLRTTNSAPNSPRTQQPQSNDGSIVTKGNINSNNPKTISLNLSQLNPSQGSLFLSNTYATTAQVVNAGRLTIAGNMLKLGNTLLHVALPTTTKQSVAVNSVAQTSTSNENTLLVGDGNLILTMDENKQKRTKNPPEQQSGYKSELIPMTLSGLNQTKKGPTATVEESTSNHSVQTALTSSTRHESASTSTSVESLAAVTANTVTVKSSKSARRMEVT